MIELHKRNERKPNIIELGYRPKDKLDSSKPPKGGSAVVYPPKSTVKRSDKD